MKQKVQPVDTESMTVDVREATWEQIEDLETRLERRKAQLRDLATMGAVITAIHEIDAVLSVVLDMAIPLVKGEVGLIMIQEDGQLRVKASWGVSGEFARTLLYQDDQDLASYCFAHREPVILSDLDLRSDAGILLNSVIALPFGTAEKCLGVTLIINKDEGGNFSQEDQEILEMLFNFVAVAIDNAQMMKERLERQKIEQEMLIARQIQETLLPQNISDLPGVEIGAIFYPAREVGGDFYDIIQLDDNQFCVVIGDVSNKGVPAALVMSSASSILKSLTRLKPSASVSEIVSDLNELMVTEVIKDREMFVTLFVARFDLINQEVTYCNAGHIPGLYWLEESQEIEELAIGGPIVGQFSGIAFKQGKRKIGAGDRLFVFTDGLTEAEDVDGNLFGRERVEQVFTNQIELSPREFCAQVKEWVDRFAEGSPVDSHDDFTILQVKVG